MRTLKDIFEDYAHYGSDAGHADKGSTHSYIEEYERLFAPHRGEIRFMEIGLAMGMSLKMWDEYFYFSNIIGVDISIVFEKWKTKNMNRIQLIEMDATKNDWKYPLTEYKYDIIIDDGSHMEEDQVTTFNILKNKMKKGGLYIIEDILSLDTNRTRFESLHDNCEIIDLRQKKGRFDDVLILYRF